MPYSERDRLTETRVQHDEIPLTWKLAACAAILLVVSSLAVLLTIPFSCMLNHWPQPVCRLLQPVLGQAEQGEASLPATTGQTERREP